MVPWIDIQHMIIIYSDHTHLSFGNEIFSVISLYFKHLDRFPSSLNSTDLHLSKKHRKIIFNINTVKLVLSGHLR